MNKPAVKFLFLALLVITISCICLLAWVPPVSRDALIHHLAIPKLYLQQGGIVEIPGLNFSYYPMNLDLLYLIPLSAGNDILPKYIHWLFGLLTAGMIYRYLDSRLGRAYGLFGSLFFLSIPIIVKLSITAYVDLGLIFFTTASLLLLFRWAEKSYQLRHLVLAGFCCGLAVGTKYNGLISLLLLSAFTPLLYFRTTSSKPDNIKGVGYSAVFILVALAVAAPWFIRNYMWTGNPVYPLFNTLFNPENLQSGGRVDIFTLRRLAFNEGPLQMLLLPVRVFFEGQDNIPQYFDGKLNPFLFFLPMLAFFRGKSSPSSKAENGFMLTFCVLFFLFAFFQSDMRIRYISPMVPFLVILSVLGLHTLYSLVQSFSRPGSKLTGKLLFTLLLMGTLLYNGMYIIEQFRYVQPLDYISGRINRDDYITRHRPEYPVIQVANKQTGKQGLTLCLFLGNRGYYMDFKHTFDVPTNKNSRFSQLIFNAQSAAAVRQNLLEDGYRYILLRNDLSTAWINSLKEQNQIATSFFQHHVEMVYSENGYSLFKIKATANYN